MPLDGRPTRWPGSQTDIHTHTQIVEWRRDRRCHICDQRRYTRRTTWHLEMLRLGQTHTLTSSCETGKTVDRVPRTHDRRRIGPTASRLHTRPIVEWHYDPGRQRRPAAAAPFHLTFLPTMSCLLTWRSSKLHPSIIHCAGFAFIDCGDGAANRL